MKFSLTDTINLRLNFEKCKSSKTIMRDGTIAFLCHFKFFKNLLSRNEENFSNFLMTVGAKG